MSHDMSLMRWVCPGRFERWLKMEAESRGKEVENVCGCETECVHMRDRMCVDARQNVCICETECVHMRDRR